MPYITALLLILMLAAAIWFVRKYVFAWMRTDDDVGGPGFSLSDLRQLHKSGKMTDEEFERAKAQVVQGIQRAAARQAAAQQAQQSPAQARRAEPFRKPPPDRPAV
jgi:hypothetical protein